jgi:hypothetical protein
MHQCLPCDRWRRRDLEAMLDEGAVGRRLLELGTREGGRQQEQDGQWAAVHRETPDVG